MSVDPFAQLQRCVNEFSTVQATGSRIQLEFIALERDSKELDQKFADALSQGIDVRPTAAELLSLSVERARVWKECSENATKAAVLSHQSAEAILRCAR
jgi:hypothetical protein